MKVARNLYIIDFTYLICIILARRTGFHGDPGRFFTLKLGLGEETLQANSQAVTFGLAATVSEISSMDIRRFKSFVVIVDTGSITRAADILHIAQPALSQQLAALEEHFGTKLLTRSQQGVVMTDAGAQVYRHAQIILRQMEQAHADVVAAGKQLAGRVSVGLTPFSSAATLSLELLAETRRRYPGIVLHLTESVGQTYSQMLMNNRLEIALIHGAGPMKGVRFDPLLREDFYLVCAREFRCRSRRHAGADFGAGIAAFSDAASLQFRAARGRNRLRAKPGKFGRHWRARGHPHADPCGEQRSWCDDHAQGCRRPNCLGGGRSDDLSEHLAEDRRDALPVRVGVRTTFGAGPGGTGVAARTDGAAEALMQAPKYAAVQTSSFEPSGWHPPLPCRASPPQGGRLASGDDPLYKQISYRFRDVVASTSSMSSRGFRRLHPISPLVGRCPAGQRGVSAPALPYLKSLQNSAIRAQPVASFSMLVA
ncbi:DNA-binding transcriptional LysR family regulator [Sinorhizobium fredii]